MILLSCTGHPKASLTVVREKECRNVEDSLDGETFGFLSDSGGSRFALGVQEETPCCLFLEAQRGRLKLPGPLSSLLSDCR